MKEFLFSKKGNVLRDVVNMKPQGQAQEGQAEQEKGVCESVSVHAHRCACLQVQVCYMCSVGWVDCVSSRQV